MAEVKHLLVARLPAPLGVALPDDTQLWLEDDCASNGSCPLSIGIKRKGNGRSGNDRESFRCQIAILSVLSRAARPFLHT